MISACNFLFFLVISAFDIKIVDYLIPHKFVCHHCGSYPLEKCHKIKQRSHCPHEPGEISRGWFCKKKHCSLILILRFLLLQAGSMTKPE
jgi:DNA primase large subunit